MTVTSLSLYRVHVLLLDPPLRSLDDCDLTQTLQGPCSDIRLSIQVSSWLWPHSASRGPCPSLEPAFSSPAEWDLAQPLQGVHVLMLDSALKSLDNCDITQFSHFFDVRPSVQVSRWQWPHAASTGSTFCCVSPSNQVSSCGPHSAWPCSGVRLPRSGLQVTVTSLSL